MNLFRLQQTGSETETRSDSREQEKILDEPAPKIEIDEETQGNK